MRTAMSWRLKLVVIAALLLAAPITGARSSIAAQQASEPVLGKWYGQAGTERDRVDLGFELTLDRDGKISAALYGPVFNFYGLLMPGGLTRQPDGTYVNANWAITLAIKNGELTGTMFGPTPVTLHRTRTLPTEPAMPTISAGPGPKWRTKLASGIYARAAISNSVAYVGTSGGEFHAINLKDGAFKWTYSAGRGVFGEALVTDSAVLFACDNGYLFKLDRTTGKELWRYDLGDARVSRILPHQLVPNSGEFDWDFRAPKPMLADDVVYVGSGDGGMHAVDLSTGARIWRFQAEGKVREGALIDGARLIFGTADKTVYALDRHSGVERWKLALQGPLGAPPTIIGGTLVISVAAGMIGGADPETGKLRWAMMPWLSAVMSSAVLDEGTRFFIGSSDMRRLQYMDAKDGRVIWRTDVYGAPWATPELAGDRLFVSAAGLAPYFAGVDPVVPYPMNNRGSLSALDRKTGRILWRWPMPAWPGGWANGFIASPAAADGLVVVGGLDGTLYAFPMK